MVKFHLPVQESLNHRTSHSVKLTYHALGIHLFNKYVLGSYWYARHIWFSHIKHLKEIAFTISSSSPAAKWTRRNPRCHSPRTKLKQQSPTSPENLNWEIQIQPNRQMKLQLRDKEWMVWATTLGSVHEEDVEGSMERGRQTKKKSAERRMTIWFPRKNTALVPD